MAGVKSWVVERQPRSPKNFFLLKMGRAGKGDEASNYLSVLAVTSNHFAHNGRWRFESSRGDLALFDGFFSLTPNERRSVQLRHRALMVLSYIGNRLVSQISKESSILSRTTLIKYRKVG